MLLIRKARGGNLRRLIACFVVATFFVAFAPALATAPPERAQVIIVFKERPNAALIRGVGGEVITTYNIIPGLAARVPTRALEELGKNPAVAYIEPDAVVHALEQQVPWGISRIGAPSAWSSSTGADVKVAILDTGIQHDHPDLAANVKGGISVVGETDSTDPLDWNDGDGHGTHVAGTVAAVNNDVGVVGSAPDAWLYGVKVLFDNGEGFVSDVIDGIDWSVENGMQVLNMSLGTDVHLNSFEDACDQAYEAGLLLVAAAGNEGDGDPDTTELSYPAAYNSVMAVAATDSNDQVPSWSNSGPFVELAAPGVGIYSTHKGSGYTTKTGTSTAAPHVSGTAALVWAWNPSLTNVQVRSILQQTAEDLGSAGRDTVYGYGLVRADEAVPTYGIEASISPSYQSALPGITLEYTVSVINLGNVADNYSLTVSDNAGWGPTLSENRLSIDGGDSKTVTLSVTIPEGAVPCTEDNIWVTATGFNNPEPVEDNDNCVAQVAFVPDYVYLTWASPDTAHTINVSWRTDGNYVGEVRYDNEPRGGDPDAYSYSTGGTGGLTTPELTGYIHHVELTGLEPDTIYYFVCGNSSYGWSDEHSFQTAPDQRTSFKFATGGDSRDDNRWDYHDYWPSARDDVSREMAGHNPSFVLFLGDYLWSSEDPGPGYAENDTWDNWLGAAFKYWRTDDNRLIPQIPVIGNHEIVYPEPSDYDPETDATNYYTVFNLPGNERWYALNWGPDLRIIVLDSEVLWEGSDTWQEQLEWLESELKNSENYLWKVVAFHRPIVSSGGWNWHGRLEDWGYLFTKYGVDVVFQAHIHWYDRLYPIDSDPPPGEVAPPREGVVYLVSGGWGGPLSYGSPQEYTAYGPESTYHFTLVDVFENGTSHLQAVDRGGNVFDELYIQKSYKVGVSISPSENDGLPCENLTYTVTVTNVGILVDNYDLRASDNENWNLTLLDNLLVNVQPGENRVVTLSVTIPENAIGCDDNIIVIVTSMADNTMSDNDSCIAHAVSSNVEFSFVTLYEVRLDAKLYLENGSKLVVKFYTYGDAFENENVFWSGTTPAHVAKFENVRHPENIGVKKARLDLTTDDTENVIATIASLVVRRDDLFGRVMEIKGRWPYASPDERNALFQEIMDIKGQWPSAPS